jgi:hypothetical protein
MKIARIILSSSFLLLNVASFAGGGSKFEDFVRSFGIKIDEASLGIASSQLPGERMVEQIGQHAAQLELVEKLNFFGQVLSAFNTMDESCVSDPDEEEIKKKIVKATFSFSTKELKQLRELQGRDKEDVIKLFMRLNDLFTDTSAPTQLRAIILQLKLTDKFMQKKIAIKPVTKKIQPIDNNYYAGPDSDEEKNNLTDTCLLTEELVEHWQKLQSTKSKKKDLEEKIAYNEAYMQGITVLEPYLKNIPLQQTPARSEFIDPMIERFNERKQAVADELLSDFLIMPRLHDVEKAQDEELKNKERCLQAKYDRRVRKLNRLESQKMMLENRLQLLVEQESHVVTQKKNISVQLTELDAQIATYTQKLQRVQAGKKLMTRFHFEDAIAQKKFDALKDKED